MKKTLVLYGMGLALLVFFLKSIEYRFLLSDISEEIYVGIIAVFFTVVGIWAGLRLTRKASAPEPAAPATERPGLTTMTAADAEQAGISKRELEVLGLIASGYSNQEIADKLFVSLNTVKKHSSSLFQKLEVKRRTQAVEKARTLGLLQENADSTKV